MRIVSNSVFMPQAFAECILLFTVAGSMSFTPKYIEAQFSVPTWKVNMLIGRWQYDSYIFQVPSSLTLFRNRNTVPIDSEEKKAEQSWEWGRC